jgi:hypothetical protein
VGRAQRIAGVVVGALGLRLARLAVDRSSDARNVRALAAHLDCSLDDARRVYGLARQYGYGAAYEEVFGKPATAAGLSEAGADPNGVHLPAAEALQSGAGAAAGAGTAEAEA